MKKRVLALMMSAVMLLGETLPVMAIEDTVAVSEDEITSEVIDADVEDESEVVAYETKDVIVEEAPAAETAAVEEVAAATEEINIEDIEGDEFDCVSLFDNYEVSGTPEAGSLSLIHKDFTNKTITGGSFEADKPYNLDTTIAYRAGINYRARKIKPVEDLEVQATKSGLFDLAKDLTTTGSFTTEVITFKTKAKNNKNATSDAYFTVSAKVNKTVAKNLGIKGKPLKTLKKACKAFSKSAKTTKLTFEIIQNPIELLDAYNDIVPISTCNKWTGAYIKYKELRVRLDDGKQEAMPSNTRKWSGWKKWYKIPKSEYSYEIIKRDGKVFIKVTGKGKNYTGTCPEWWIG